MNARTCAAMLILLLPIAASRADAQGARLQFASKPRLVECQDRPCFRMDVLAVDAQQQPVELPDDAKFEVFKGDEKLPNVVVTKLRARPIDQTTTSSTTSSSSSSSSRTSSTSQVPRVYLVLFDTSGSMNERLSGGETKFAIARRQLELLFEGFRDGVDQMAVIPFDSQRVGQRIRGAKFETTRAALMGQVNALKPNPRGNTALFSAIDEALKKLEPVVTTGAQVALVVFTDGKNDVGHRGDDEGLLGDEGLARIKKAAGAMGITTYTIGYGASGVAFDEPTLRSLAYPSDKNYFSASDEAGVKAIFRGIVVRGLTAVRLLAGPIRDRREQLTGQSLVFRVTTGDMSAESPPWEGAPLIVPPNEGELTPEERAAVLRWPVEDVLPSVVIRVVVLLGYSLLLAALWFGLPRLIWPERYIPKPAFAAPRARPAAAARPAGRPGAPGARPGPGGRPVPGARPEVTIPSARQPGRPAPAPGAREAPAPRAPRSVQPGQVPRPRESPAPPDIDETTRIFIPPAKKPGRES